MIQFNPYEKPPVDYIGRILAGAVFGLAFTFFVIFELGIFAAALAQYEPKLATEVFNAGYCADYCSTHTCPK